MATSYLPISDEEWDKITNRNPKPLQCLNELRKLFDLVRMKECDSLLEIGSMNGSSLLILGRAIHPGGRIVSIDLVRNESERRKRKDAIDKLKNMGYAAKEITGDSHDPEVVKSVGVFDFVFIDGDHTYDGVSADYKNYRGRKITGFHDIANGKQFVPQFWGEIISGNKRKYKMFVNPDMKYGIGAIYES